MEQWSNQVMQALGFFGCKHVRFVGTGTSDYREDFNVFSEHPDILFWFNSDECL